MSTKGSLRTITHQVDLCVVGGGLAGLCAAVAAARNGAKVVLMQDRPVLGGNCSSEIRMWIWGAGLWDGRHKNVRETGIIEELLLENLYRNPMRNYSIWDSILYGKARFQERLTLLLNCSCNDLEMRGSQIRLVKGWQTTTQTWHIVEAGLFADCSGDSILAPLSGAEFRFGREGTGEYGESFAPSEADELTMGMSCLIQLRETDQPQTFTPPAWARVYKTDGDLHWGNRELADEANPDRRHDLRADGWQDNFWWLEMGGDRHSIHDTEEIRDELLRTALGVWDHVKNQAPHGAENWVLDWAGFLPGKRESRRYVGDHVVTQKDVVSGGRFDDVVAYGGWPIDEHHPGGLGHSGQPSKLYFVPSPWGIPYRALYSKNISNLYFAGRNISVTHTAMASSRVMATCALLGQAVGTAAAIAARHGLTPRGVYLEKMALLQQALLDDDCYVPGVVRRTSEIARTAVLTASAGDPEPLRNGLDRPVGEADNGWEGQIGDSVQYAFPEARRVNELRFVFDSDLNRVQTTMLARYALRVTPVFPPSTLVRAFRVDVLESNGQWSTTHREVNNHRRLVRLPLGREVKAIRFIPESTWGSEAVHVFSWDVH